MQGAQIIGLSVMITIISGKVNHHIYQVLKHQNGVSGPLSTTVPPKPALDISAGKTNISSAVGELLYRAPGCTQLNREIYKKNTRS
jgi:hypothetical protein